MYKESRIEDLVSVVVPCYNHQDFVQQAIQSIIDQDYDNIELIIIDDGSTDASVTKIKEMVKSCEQRFKRFEFRSRPNKGLCATLNEALAWCEGEFFSAVASDDIWLSHKTRVQVNIFLKPENVNVAVISGEMIRIDSKGIVENEVSFVPPSVSFYNFLDVYHSNSRINAPTAMIRMHCIRETGGYKADVIIEDFYMWLAITKLGYTIMSVKEKFSKYRIHDDNTFSKIEKMHGSILKILEYFKPSEEDFSKAIKDSYQRSFKAAAVYKKSYAFKVILRRKVNIFSKGFIFYFIVLFLPKILFDFFIKIYRTLKKIF